MIEILACAGPATVQDCGRPGYRHLGVPLAGALDGDLLQLANALAGNPLTTAAIEVRLVGPRLRAHAPVLVALGGEMDGRIDSADGSSRPARAWASHRLAVGDTLTLGAVRGGVAYLAVGGGIDVPVVLGSRSTYLRAAFGGFAGRQLAAGDRLAIGGSGAAHALECVLATPPSRRTGVLRVLAGPQREYFTLAAWEQFVGSEFVVSREADRMGLRLDGACLKHDPAYGADIVSDAVTPGAIQVAADGRAIVLLADCQTVGGYPKIATVIAADLNCLAHALPGTRLRFAAVTRAEALAARRETAAALAKQIAAVIPVAAEIDLDALYSANLIDGVVHEH